MKTELIKKLLQIQRQDQAAADIEKSENLKNIHYENRTFFLYEAMALATQCGYKAGVRIDPSEPDWPVVFIELPTGQISYHIQQHPIAWDGHTTEQKRLRMLAFIADIAGA